MPRIANSTTPLMPTPPYPRQQQLQQFQQLHQLHHNQQVTHQSHQIHCHRRRPRRRKTLLRRRHHPPHQSHPGRLATPTNEVLSVHLCLPLARPLSPFPAMLTLVTLHLRHASWISWRATWKSSGRLRTILSILLYYCSQTIQLARPCDPTENSSVIIPTCSPA